MSMMSNNKQQQIQMKHMTNNYKLYYRKPSSMVGGVYLVRLLMNGILIGYLLWPKVLLALVPCNTTNDQCAQILRQGSECIDGFCSNPYISGCLVNQKPGWTRKRVCNSEDSIENALNGICRPPHDGLNYMEIRIATQNWESVFFEAWVLQILLSEILDVPTTLETGTATAKVNYYDPMSPFDFGEGNVFEALQTSITVGGDCRNVPKQVNDTYTACCHVIPEVWGGHEAAIENMTFSGVIEPPTFIGVIGQEGWFLPQMTVKRDPSLLGYFGMSGEENRRKLADRFLRPTTWADYCNEVSTDHCSKPTNITKRAPIDDTEYDRMFVEGLYTGHFRKTEDNDCDQWPHNCTGNIIDYPCDWSSYVVPQTYWLNISLKSSGKLPSGGYTYDQILEIWQAANATSSDIVGMMWFPHALYQQYLHTETQMIQVTMPAADYVCVNHRMNPEARCSGTLAEQVGPPEGVCSDPPLSILKLISTSLYTKTNDPKINIALRSPGYESVKNFRLNNIDLSEIFDHWLHAVDQKGFGPRQATCQWVIENFDTVLGLIPKTYPRVLKENTDIIDGPFFNVALTFGIISISLVLVCCVITYRQRDRKIIKYSQIEFMALLLIGLLMVSAASIVQAIVPTSPRCVAVTWLVNLGYTLELVPLIVKVAAINKLMQAAQKMKRIKLTRKGLFGAVCLICCVMVVVLIFWTVLDPPRRVTYYHLTNDISSEGQTIVTTDYYCKSSSSAWTYWSVGSQCFLLLCASALAFQTRKMRKDMNETQTLAVLIYSHFMFVTMRVAALLLQGILNVSVVSEILSMIYSVDSMATVVIYFVPKFLWFQLVNDAESDESNFSSVAQFRNSVSYTPNQRSSVNFGERMSRSRESSEDSMGGMISPNDKKGFRKRILDKNILECKTEGYSSSTIPQERHLQAKSETNDDMGRSASALAYGFISNSHAEKETKLTTQSEEMPLDIDGVDTSAGDAIFDVEKTAQVYSISSELPTSTVEHSTQLSGGDGFDEVTTSAQEFNAESPPRALEPDYQTSLRRQRSSKEPEFFL